MILNEGDDFSQTCLLSDICLVHALCHPLCGL